MFDVVETYWLDLKRMKIECDMNTTVIISQIEDYYQSCRTENGPKKKRRSEARQTHLRLPEFIQFLLEERLAMEYMEDDIRESSGQQ